MLGLGCRKLAVCCVKHPGPEIISYRSIVMNLKVLICIHIWRLSVNTKDIRSKTGSVQCEVAFSMFLLYLSSKKAHYTSSK